MSVRSGSVSYDQLQQDTLAANRIRLDITFSDLPEWIEEHFRWDCYLRLCILRGRVVAGHISRVRDFPGWFVSFVSVNNTFISISRILNRPIPAL